MYRKMFPFIGEPLYPCLEINCSHCRRLSGAELPLHRPDAAAGSAGVAQVLRARLPHPEDLVDAQRVPATQVGEVSSL